MEASGPANASAANTKNYDYRHGETDLFEGDLNRKGTVFLTGILVTLILFMCGGLALMAGPTLLSTAGDFSLSADSNATDTLTPASDRPAFNLPTITEGPPTLTPSHTPPPTSTPTIEPTREPCFQEVRAGEGLINVVSRCGHVNNAVLDIVMEINNLPNVNSIREGQILEIPWPTETPDPEAAPAQPDDGDTEESASGQAVSQGVDVFADDFDPFLIPTATLQPGIQFHTVQPNENIIIIAVEYGANVEILSQLNPEITFSQCDFGQNYGGPRCTVPLGVGQRVRVPAPTLTPTLPPTATGNETATPTATATFNAPSQRSPSNRAFFRNDQLITLRWVPTGTLAANEVYLIRVEDTTAGIIYTAETRNTYFVIPDEWQGRDDERHEYQWSISVIEQDDPDNPSFTTNTLIFTWESRG